jgi:hypothetical protein
MQQMVQGNKLASHTRIGWSEQTNLMTMIKVFSALCEYRIGIVHGPAAKHTVQKPVFKTTI